jgi:hypothetical protein
VIGRSKGVKEVEGQDYVTERGIVLSERSLRHEPEAAATAAAAAAAESAEAARLVGSRRGALRLDGVGGSEGGCVWYGGARRSLVYHLRDMSMLIESLDWLRFTYVSEIESLCLCHGAGTGSPSKPFPTPTAVRLRMCIRVRGEIMGSPKCGIVGNSQSVLMMTNAIIFARTRRRRARG